MTFLHCLVRSALVFAALAWCGPAAAEVPWSALMGIDAKTLDSAQKGRVEKLLDRLANTRGCEGTLSSCIKEGDLTARRHGGYVARMVRKNKTDKDIESGIADRAASAFPARTFKVNVEDRPTRGKDTAPVTLVEFACFECPYCAYLAPKLAELGKTLGGKVRHVYKFFPVRSHERGVPAALSGLAAFRQDKFWPMHDLLYSNRAALGDKDLQAYAKKAGLDLAQYKAAIAAPESMKVVEKDKLEGMRLGVEGTPAFFVNGKLYKGSADYDELMDRIAEEIEIVEGRVR